MKRLVWSGLLALGFALPATAQVTSGFVTANVHLRAGPDSAYPIIAVVPMGTGLSIQGCTAGWQWCDVITMGTRGWVAGTFIQYTYQNQPVVVMDYGARIGIPIIPFVIGSYWGSHYRDRPFYRQRDYWYHRPIAPRPPARPPGYRPPPHPPGGHRPPPPGAGPGTRPPGGHHPPSQGGRPPNHGNTRPANPGSRPPPGQGQQPPGAGNRPPQPGSNRPAPRPRPAPNNSGGNNA